jgi:hypothetical protein
MAGSVKLGDLVIMVQDLRNGRHPQDPSLGAIGVVNERDGGAGGFWVHWNGEPDDTWMADYQIRLATPEEVAAGRLDQAGGL